MTRATSDSPPPERTHSIEIQGARSHNLRDVHCHVPLGGLTVVTGVSGSGKSTLAFDTLYAEGQRRYVTSLSTYARQFLERLPRPDVDFISNLPPAIAIEQHNRVTNARSTVGTATEILDHLRLLFAKIGETRCPDCDQVVESGTVEAVADRILDRWDGGRVSVGTSLPSAGRAGAVRERLLADGYARALTAEGDVVELTEVRDREFSALRKRAFLLLDRLAVRRGESRARLAEAIAAAFSRGDGICVVVDETGEIAEFREGFVCGGCARRFAPPEPALFSFNSPRGACPECEGFGRIPGLDWARVVPDPSLTLAEAPIAPFRTPRGRAMQRDLLRACRRRSVPTDQPFEKLTDEQRAFVLEGDEDEGGEWYGVRGFFDWLEGRRYKVQARIQIARYRRFDPCPACAGTRLAPDARSVFVAGRHVGEVARDTIAELETWLAGLELGVAEIERAGRLLATLRARVRTALEVGLGYLGLDRQVRTLSGGEAQRIQLATALGGSLTAALYVLDEPSIGLHARDVERLLEVVKTIRNQGNTVVVVEHAPEIIRAADHVIDLGPGAGRAGGRLVVEGNVETVREHRESLTGRALRPDREVKRRGLGGSGKALSIRGASAHNLQDLDVDIPLGRLVVVTGVSGAGKSTLVRSVLVGHLKGDPERGACRAIEGREWLGETVLVDASPLSRSPRSNAATISKAFEGIRRAFASTPEARRRRVGPGWFSFNVKGGRCESCEGAGEVVVDMQFLEDVRVPCDACDGSRYRREVLEVQLRGRSIVEVLGLTLEEAVDVFRDLPRVRDRLLPFTRVGLGYLTLGQPLSTLSGGERQRVRLALALAGGHPDSLYVLDEPTTGLHALEVERLLDCLDELLAAGGSVLVVEHNLDVIRAADHVIDLGPEGGPGGGRLVAEGSPAEIAASPSWTGAALRELC